MSENNKSLLPDIITPVSNAIHQNIPETEKQADGALSTVVGFFNNVVLYPVKKANLTFRYKLEAFEDDLKEKTKEYYKLFYNADLTDEQYENITKNAIK